jgi:hypothetical protein
MAGCALPTLCASLLGSDAPQVVNRPPEERVYASEHSRLINHAYSVLKKPLSRATYIVRVLHLLWLQG